jgi:hypothetical protein
VATTHLKAAATAVNEAVRLAQVRQLLTAADAAANAAEAAEVAGGRRGGAGAEVPIFLCGDWNTQPDGPVYAAVAAHPRGFVSLYNDAGAKPAELARQPSAVAAGGREATSMDLDPALAAAAYRYGLGEPAFTTWKVRRAGGHAAAAGRGGAGDAGGAPHKEVRRTIDYIWAGGLASGGCDGEAACPSGGGESGGRGGDGARMLALAARLRLPSADDVGAAALPCEAYPSDHLSLAVDLHWR